MSEQNTQKEEKRAYLRKQGGIWLKHLREDAGLTQRDLAALLDLRIYTFISQLELGRGKIPLDRYREWAKALKVEQHDFAVKAFSFYEPSIFEIFKDVDIVKSDRKRRQSNRKLT